MDDKKDKKYEGARQVSFIDGAVQRWLDAEAPVKGLCLKRFRADLRVEGLAGVKAGDIIRAEDGTEYEITITGKKCFAECELLQEKGRPCPLAGGVAFGKRI